VSGLAPLRDAVAEQLSAYHGTKYERANVLVSNGAKHSLANLFMVALAPGDEVVFASPYWVSYPEMVRLGDGVPVVVETTSTEGFKMSPSALEARLSARTKFLLINSPSNPTGVGYTQAELRALGEVLVARAPRAWVLVDDIYRTLTYGDFHHASAVRALAGLTDRVIVVDGLSKSHAMTGYRIGFTVGPKSLIAAANAIQGQTTSGAATPSQWAALAAMTDPACAADTAAMREAFARRREIMLAGLRAIEGVSVVPPDGAFYAFADFRAHLGRNGRETDIDLARFLLEEKLVATVPGTPFGTPGHLRLSFATDDESITAGLERIRLALTR
jgi:aspartate aminotransferase